MKNICYNKKMIDIDDQDSEEHTRLTVTVRGEDEMRALAQKFAQAVSPDQCEEALYEDCFRIGLSGEVGAGKSTFVKGFVSHFNDAVLRYRGDFNQRVWVSEEAAGCIASFDAMQYDEDILQAADEHNEYEHAYHLIEHPEDYDDSDYHIMVSVAQGASHDERQVTIICDADTAGSKSFKTFQDRFAI